MNYKVGDKVRVKENLIINAHYGFGAVFSPYMEKYSGKVLTIREVFDDGCYYAKESVNWPWSDGMLEPADATDIRATGETDQEPITVVWKNIYSLIKNDTGEAVASYMDIRGWEMANLLCEYIKEHGHGYSIACERMLIERSGENG